VRKVHRVFSLIVKTAVKESSTLVEQIEPEDLIKYGKISLKYQLLLANKL
jgi:hypothetical protein